MKAKLEVGDRVKFSVKFLRATFQFTGDTPRARGKIMSIKDYGGPNRIAIVEWDKPWDQSQGATVHMNNLVHEHDSEPKEY